MQTSPLMMYKEIMHVSSEIRKEHTNPFCVQNIKFFNVTPW